MISRDDTGDPATAIRIAEELVTKEGAVLIFGTFLSNIGLAVADFAQQKQVLFLASEPLSDAIVWSKGNKYTYRLRPSTHMQARDAGRAGRQAGRGENGPRSHRTMPTVRTR